MLDTKVRNSVKNNLVAHKNDTKQRKLTFQYPLKPYHSASSIDIVAGFSIIASPFITTNRTLFSSCTTSSGKRLRVALDVASSLLLKLIGPTIPKHDRKLQHIDI
jgi:hypothetical protein